MTYSADKSAFARLNTETVANRMAPLIAGGSVATCSLVDLEVLYSARSPSDYVRTRFTFDTAYPRVPVNQPTLDRAVEIQALLAERSAHRGASIPDLIIAAAAEEAGLTVLHYDADFDLIAEVTGQPAEWVVPAGSID